MAESSAKQHVATIKTRARYRLAWISGWMMGEAVYQFWLVARPAAPLLALSVLVLTFHGFLAEDTCPKVKVRIVE